MRTQRARDHLARDTVAGEGWDILEVEAENRILLTFKKRLSLANYFFVRREGWFWSPNRKAFFRQLNDVGRNAADLMALKAPELLKPEVGGASE